MLSAVVALIYVIYPKYLTIYAKHSRWSATSEAVVYFYLSLQEASLFYGEAHRRNALITTHSFSFRFPFSFPFSLSTLARTVMMLLPGLVAPRRLGRGRSPQQKQHLVISR
jgi:hypothetical protein